MSLIKLLVLCGIVMLRPSLGQAYEVVELREGGTVQGTVRFRGVPPAPKKILITKDPGVCGAGERVIEEINVTEGGGLRNVVVYLDGIGQGKRWEDALRQAALDQRGCRFLPYIAVVPKGKELAITNSDPVPHNIHTYEVIGRARRSLFNVAQPQQGTITKPISPRSAPTVKVECDLHNFMEGWIFVAETPYTTLVDEEGRFSLNGIPQGTYRLKAWHPTLGEKEAEVVIQVGKTSAVSLEFAAQ